MKAYQIQAGAGLGGLERVERPSRDPGAYEIRVRVDAAALNHRDLSFARGQFYNPPSYPIVPLVAKRATRRSVTFSPVFAAAAFTTWASVSDLSCDHCLFSSA